MSLARAFVVSLTILSSGAVCTDNADSVQIAFTALAGGPSSRWTEVMRAIAPSTLAPNSGYFIADGSAHCTTPGNSFYSVTADGVRLVEWLAALVEGSSWARVVDCCGDTPSSKEPSQVHQQTNLAGTRSDNGRQQWQCAAAFAEHYWRAGFPPPNSTDASRIEGQYRDFERSYCDILQ